MVKEFEDNKSVIGIRKSKKDRQQEKGYAIYKTLHNNTTLCYMRLLGVNTGAPVGYAVTLPLGALVMIH
jgi:hypothetical protein